MMSGGRGTRVRSIHRYAAYELVFRRVTTLTGRGFLSPADDPPTANQYPHNRGNFFGWLSSEKAQLISASQAESFHLIRSWGKVHLFATRGRLLEWNNRLRCQSGPVRSAHYSTINSENDAKHAINADQ
jgi:hypothetical protein